MKFEVLTRHGTRYIDIEIKLLLWLEITGGLLYFLRVIIRFFGSALDFMQQAEQFWKDEEEKE